MTDRMVCLCFHVSEQKIRRWIRVEKPVRVGQLSECYGAGTECGWCRPYLKRLYESAREGEKSDFSMPEASEYAEKRQEHLKRRKTDPPPEAAE